MEARRVRGEGRSDINATFVQPFISKGLGRGRPLSAALKSTYDREGRHWTVSLKMGYSKVSRIGQQLVSYQSGVRY